MSKTTYQKLFTQSLIYALGSLSPKLIYYFFLRFFTNQLSLGEFSLYSDMYSISFLMISFLSFGLETAYFRFLYKKEHLDKKKVFSNALFILIFLASLFLIFSLIFSKKIALFLNYSTHLDYISFFSWIIFFEVLCVLPFAYLRMEGKAFRYTFIKVFNSIFFSFCILFVFYIYKNKDLNFVLKRLINYTDKTGLIFFVNVLSSLLNLIFLLPYLFKLEFKKISLTFFYKMIKYGFPIMIGSLAFALNENLGKLFIKRIFSDQINGAYSACYKIATLMALHVSVFKLSVEPFFFKKSSSQNAKSIYAEITYFFVLIGSIFYVLLFSNLKLLAHFFINPNYHEGLKIVPIVLMANLFLGIYNNLSISYKLMDKPYMGTLFSLLGVVLTLIFNLALFIPGVNFMLSAWGTLASYGSMMLVSFFWGKKHYPISYPILPIFIYLISATFVGYILYHCTSLIFNIVGQILYLSLILYFERNKLKSFLCKKK